MLTLNLLDVPNQSFSTQLLSKRFTFHIKLANGIMIADITCDNTPLVTGERILPNQPIIAYPRLECGNFILQTEDDDLPDWQKFGKTQQLIYLTPEEIMSLRQQKGVDKKGVNNG